MKEIVIIGHNIELQECDKAQLKGITIGDKVMYTFYEGEYLGVSMMFVEPKNNNPTPRSCAYSSRRWQELFGKPAVFILASGMAYERQRLIEKGVFFVMSDKFAYLPMLVANERLRKTELAKRLTPVAQYILLYHLQVESLEGRSAKDMVNLLPYSYESVTLGLTCLSDLGLCKKISDGAKSKIIHFVMKGEGLWNQAQDFLISPIDKTVWCEGILEPSEFPTCSINALSHYSWLNPDDERMIAVSSKQLKKWINEKQLIRPNKYDGNILIEGWKYPPVCKLGDKCEYVDKLSMLITLKDDPDARVEGERIRVIKEMVWKG